MSRNKPQAKTRGGDRIRHGCPVQTRIHSVAFKALAARAENDTRSVANYVANLIYQHLGMLPRTEEPAPE